jgi:hypothetical protein
MTLGCVFLDLWDPRPHQVLQIGYYLRYTEMTLGCVFLDLWDPRPHLANQIGVKSNRAPIQSPLFK